MIKIFLTILIVSSVLSCSDHQAKLTTTQPESIDGSKAPAVMRSFVETHTIANNSTTYSSFKSLGVSSKEILALVEVSKEVYRLDRIKAKSEFNFNGTAKKNKLIGSGLSSSLADLKIDKTDNVWKATKVEQG